MKKIGFAVIATLVLAMSLTSCEKYAAWPWWRRQDSDESRGGEISIKSLVSTSCDVHYVQGNAPMRITGPERMLKRIITECNGNTLTIKLTKAEVWWNGMRATTWTCTWLPRPNRCNDERFGRLLGWRKGGQWYAEHQSLREVATWIWRDIICDEMTTTLKGSDIDIQRLECGKSSVFLSGATATSTSNSLIWHNPTWCCAVWATSASASAIAEVRMRTLQRRIYHIKRWREVV